MLDQHFLHTVLTSTTLSIVFVTKKKMGQNFNERYSGMFDNFTFVAGILVSFTSMVARKNLDIMDP